ncbi:MAG TPA: acyl carrier protein [Longimicrobiaceae bacterium]|nr:acyl carrier protein [Longimicrobiaceae bacterium]
MTVHERLEEVFRTILDDEGIVLTENTTAADVPGWDSLAHVNLMFSIEQEFGVQFTGNQFSEFENVGELERFLESRSYT